MAHLAKAIVASETPITMASAVTVGSYPGEYTLDEEAVLVIGGSGGTSLSVVRGARGTAAAPHAAGTELVVADPTPGVVVKDEGSALNNGALVGSLNFTGAGVAASMVGDVATVNVAGGGGGGGGSVTRLGPYSLTYIQLPVDGSQVTIAAGGLPIGSLVQAFVVCRENLSGTGLGYAYLDVSMHNQRFASFDVNSAQAQAAPDEVPGAPIVQMVGNFGYGSDTDVLDIKVSLVTDASDLNAGAVDIFLLITTA